MPEVPVALEFNGLSYAVMMVSPSDLADFARGFALAAGLARSAADVTNIAVAEVELGFIVRTSVRGWGIEQPGESVRTRATEFSCGLCGFENIEAISKPLPNLMPHASISASAVLLAISSLRNHQALNQRTGAARGAAFCDISGQILAVCEDFGRHNAIDKLIGTMVANGLDAADGFFISTARCSCKIVEKVFRAGGTTLVTASLLTSPAVSQAANAGLSLLCLARNELFLALDADFAETGVQP